MIRRSIRLRLTLWYAGTILALLLVGTITSRIVIRDALEDEFTRSLESSAGLVQGFFRLEIAEYRQVEPTLAHIAGEMVIPDRRVEFVRPNGTVFTVPLPPRARALLQLEPPVRVQDAMLDPALAPGWRVRTTASRASLERRQQSVDRGAWIAVALAVLIALVAGWVLTGRTLRPVGQMADAADRITAGAGGHLPIAVPDDELGRLGIRFNALLDRLDQTLARQRRFLADAAHELRTPIARARGVGELALSAPGSADDREALERTQHELETMSHLVDELLELARIEANGSLGRSGTMYLDDVVAEVARRFDALARTRGQRIEVEVPEEVPIEGDLVAIERLVGILVDNALRYSPEGGVVRVAARRVGQSGEVIVIDEGIGIPPDERIMLFERFFRGARARKTAPDGSGLGLAIAQKIAQQHRASIEFDPDVVRGTHAIVRFALRQASRVQQE
ncbi:MAG: Adaptive-response sensory-kinase SasA [Gemmatimonadaceae bacterium]|nr:Adaptive-response sensory-kinase SasA [Gemmatimonadaceae bacterium]